MVFAPALPPGAAGQVGSLTGAGREATSSTGGSSMTRISSGRGPGVSTGSSVAVAMIVVASVQGELSWT